ncbi:hypothetical protein Cgig2_028360 [Carnegiea gigantea]|uniref:Matrin-type domain-containing protein n=1 Tax=Carnegiea gigantea TaxID=171969 RepID=A0A9Q1K281_9CARY|nr:hypothetical protein Cgig2_028360 [Carnegiea gigantea]
MSSTLLEVTRASHEEVERLERLIVKELQNESASSKDRLYQSHRVRNMIEQIISTTDKLVDIYEDKDNARKDEIAALGGQTATGTNVFSAFYDRLKEIREYHRRHPAARVVDAGEEYEQMFKEDPILDFSGEEAFGRYLDLHEFYNRYINSKFGEPMEYTTYLDVFSKPEKVPRKFKMTRQYRDYIIDLLEYLISFFERTEPLNDLDRIFSKALAALGLKTGGTVQQRAERLFLTKNTPVEMLDRKHFAKPLRGSEQNGNMPTQKDLKELALMEAKMKRLCELLNETIVRTKENTVKKQGMTWDEIVQEQEEEDIQADTESDEEEQPIYNPLKLPLGWDGKPIPYWLYKLHGLGQEFKCEICGNHSYWGRRAFERHFKEWRHQHGMRCLGIPNTKNFNEITSIEPQDQMVGSRLSESLAPPEDKVAEALTLALCILGQPRLVALMVSCKMVGEDAKRLWERIQERQGLNKWRPDLEEEYEDQEGNIYNKKTFTDLQRQGLI